MKMSILVTLYLILLIMAVLPFMGSDNVNIYT